ncbi:MAG: site-specific integrase [Prevotellaceae bacterium]|jgi:integrase|nr:site-specific integrase [Prevotellaceae bacterium]
MAANLFNGSHGNITVSVICDTRRKTSDEKYPVKVRVTYQRERQYYKTGKKLTIDEWNDLAATKKHDLLAVKKELQAAFTMIDNVVTEMNNEGRFSFDNLNVQLGKGVTDTINTAFAAKIEQLEKDGHVGNMDIYVSAKRSFERYAGDRIPFDSINTEWLKSYEKHLLNEGKSYVTIGMYLRCLRAIINIARKSGTIKESQYPFGEDKYRIPKGKGRKIALTLQQIKLIRDYSDGTTTTERYRDLWFFSYLCNGINFNDMLQLKYGDIDGDIISWYRGKTINTSEVKEKIEAVVTPEMADLIEKYGNPATLPSNFIFPYLKGDETPIERKKIIKDVTKRTNKRLKLIGKAVGIEGLTTYVARHSFATVLKRSGAGTAFISESMGHGSEKTTQTYLGSFEIDERKKNAALLTNWD